MAIRNIRIRGDKVLEKKSRPVEQMTPRLKNLVADMLDTMYQQMGVGLAAPQVGILKRIVVIDTGDDPHVLINPRIVETDGEQTGDEGCLSVPGLAGQVTRPNHVVVEAMDENMQPFTLEGTELLARAICHECDHLDGILYTTLVEGELHEAGREEEEDEEEAEDSVGETDTAPSDKETGTVMETIETDAASSDGEADKPD